MRSLRQLLKSICPPVFGAKRSNRRQRAMQSEMLEVRQLLSAIVLDFPGIDGNSSVSGATATEMTIDGFKWGFRRDISSATSPLTASNVEFVKPATDSVSPDLFASAAYGVAATTPAKVRILDTANNGRELLSLNLSNPRMTNYTTAAVANEQGESGDVTFSSLVVSQTAYNASNVATKRNANWNLLNGAVTSSQIAGPGNIDSGSKINLETVLEINGQKLLIDGYDWSSSLATTVSATGVTAGNRTTGEFKVSRLVDTGTAGLLGSTAAGTVFDKITITDRRTKSVGGNEVYLQFDLYNAFLSSFDIAAESGSAPTNGLGFGYSKIDVTYMNVDSKGVVTPLKSTRDSVAKTGKAATLVTDPTLVDNSDSSFLDFGGVRVRYDDLAWQTEKPVTIGSNAPRGATKFSDMTATLPIAPAAAGLIGNLFTGKIHTTVKATELNANTPTNTIDNWTFTSTAVSKIRISSKNMSEPDMTMDLTFAKAEETFAQTVVTSTGNKLVTTKADYHRGTQTSTLPATTSIDFGGLSSPTGDGTTKVPALANAMFVLTITENGKVSEIPVDAASWGVINSGSVVDGGAGKLKPEAFTIKAKRGLHSPGFFLAASRGDEIDNVQVSRYQLVAGKRLEAYRWDLGGAFFTEYSSTMQPGSNVEESDQVSIKFSRVRLAAGSRVTDPNQAVACDFEFWNFLNNKPEGAFPSLPRTGWVSRPPLTADDGKFHHVTSTIVVGDAVMDSYQWGAAMAVTEPNENRIRDPRSPNVSPFNAKFFGNPHPKMLFSLFRGTIIETTDVLIRRSNNSTILTKFKLTDGLASSYSYLDTNNSSGAAVSVGLESKTITTEFFPVNATTGEADPAIAVTWDLTNAATTGEKTTGNPGFGGFQFPQTAFPPLMVEINGVGKSQFEADDYSWSVSNPVQQLVGTAANPQTLAPRTLASAKDFSITTAWDRATPALINAIGLKSKLPEIRITERANVTVNGSTQFRPVREWILTDVYVTSFGTNPNIDNRTGPVTFSFDAGKIKSNVLAYDKSGSPVSRDKTIDFETPPTVSPFSPVVAVSTGETRFIPLPPRVINSLQAPATLRYSASVVSGGNVFTQVTVNTQNTLVLDYKPGSSGVAQVRVETTNDFGVSSSVLMDVVVDADGVIREPAGTNKTVTFAEDTTYVIDTADFGFSDPNDFPANAMDGVRITTLPGKGSLLLNNVPVTIGQNIPVASLNADQLRYQPDLNGEGTNYTSFTFQVQDKGATSNLDLSPNVFTFNVTNTNDAPTFPNSTTVVAMPNVNEDSSSHNGMLVSSIVSVITDIDPGAVKGIAVVDAPTAIGLWQFSLDNGTTWRSLAGAAPENTRLLAANATTRVRFLPNANAFGASLLRFRAWDQTAGNAGGLGSLTDFASTRTFSSNNANLSVQVVAVNDAPVLSSVPPTLPLIDEDPVYSPGPTSGVPISALVGGMTDVDSSAQKGIAVIEVSTSNGQWQYSLTNGESWVNLSPLSLATARLIRNSSSNRIRFLPNANISGEARLTFQAWDTTQGDNGETFDLSGLNTSGGTNAFSDVFVTVSQTIRAINDAPTVSAPVSQSVTMDTPLVFSTANGNALSVGDLEAIVQPVQVTVSAANGTLTLSSTSGLQFISGANGQSAFTVAGTVSQLNVALNGATFTPTLRSFGNSGLTITLNDQGNIGGGGAKTATATVNIPVSLPGSVVALGGLTATAPTIRRLGNRDGSTAVPDFYTFTIASASDVRVNLSGLAADVDLRVFSSVGQMVGQSIFFSNNMENILMTALPAGTYLIDVRGQVVSPYHLTLTTATTSDDLITQAFNIDSPTAVTRPTVRQSSTGTSADLQDYFRFSMTAASALRINLSGLSQDVDFELLDSVGRLIQSAGVSGNTIENILTSSLAVGTYYVRVFASGGLLTSDYDLTISTATTSDDLLTNPTSLGILGSQGSHRRTGNVAVGTDLQDYYAFVASGDVAISVSGFSNDVDVQVLDQFGRVLASSARSGNRAESINLNIASGFGSIYVRIFAFSGSSSYVFEARANSNAANADDLLSTATALPNPITSLTRSGSVGGTGGSGDPQDYYHFELTTARNISLTLTGISADLDIDLLDQFGNVLFFSRAGGTSNEAINVSNLAVGVYFIRIYPFTPSTVSNYTLGLTV